MYQRYSRNGCPSDFPVHTKCVGLFQSFDGVDVLLFAMYVYEYGDDCPAPNRRRVYISYLDSVQYFQPKAYRSIVYQSLIVEYLRFVKKRGFHTAHIWSCPPAPGDEYVFYCHPSHQKIPQEEKLRKWYYQTLEKAKADGIVIETTDFYDEYFNNDGADAPVGYAPDPMSLPYFEGGYIPGEIEKLISQISKEEKKALANGKSSSAQRTGSKKGTRSNPGNLVNQSQDKVMLRLGTAIQNMKDNFIIARLRNKRFVAAVDRGEDVSAWPDDDNLKPPGKDSSVLSITKAFGEDETSSQPEDKDDEASKLADKLAQVSRSITKIGNTVDTDEQFESELFENRQLFLNYCQTNHCQFDELRRSKHSTIMALYQLHNPTAPKFVSQCGACYRDIANGTRYHCNNCANFDLCQDCYRPVVSGSWTSRGSRFTHDRKHTFSQIFVENTEVSQQQQAERMKTMRPYLQVLAHAADCDGPPACNLNNCQKMKQFFSHVKTCELTHKKGCKICSRLLSLTIVHARSCTTRGACSLPFCDRIRERNERLRRQQQLMDDRRRNAQNEYYQRSSES
jgi:E1A/CREB-binding protein